MSAWSQIVNNFGGEVEKNPLKFTPPPDRKRCNQCQQYLPMDDFYGRPDKDGSKRAQCKKCYIEKQLTKRKQ